ncbi:MAG: hypothetical protein AABZ06_14160, partial [Bdellovibrionota bacterium]
MRDRLFSIMLFVLLGFHRAADCSVISSVEPKVLGRDNPTTSAAFSFATMDYLGSYGHTDGSFLSFFEADLKVSKMGRIIEAVSQAEILLTLNTDSYRSFEVPQAYIATSDDLGRGKVVLGRKFEPWSHLDENWNLGVWQPLFRWDFLAPDRVGLSGIFLNLKLDSVRLVAFGSPFFIPDRGLPMDLRDGAVRPDLPWAIVPPERVRLLNVYTPVRYNVIVPPVNEIVNKPSGSLLAHFGNEKGIQASVGYGYKPMNQLLLGYDPYLDVSTPDSPQTVVQLYPRVLYHHVGSVDAGYKGEFAEGLLSFLVEQPIRDETPRTWMTQEVLPSYAISPSMDLSVVGAGLDSMRSTRLSFSYIKQWGGNAPDAGPKELTHEGVNTFESRYPFQEAVKIGIHSPVFEKGR